MHPSQHAEKTPDKVAIVMADGGQRITYRELEDRSNRTAQLFRSLGLSAGDGVAFMLENRPTLLELCIAARRAGLYYTTISSRLTAAEAEYIVGDSGAKVFITSNALRSVAEKLETPGVVARYMLDGTAAGYDAFEAAAAAMPAERIADETDGESMLYSSGTTGRPKGVRRPLRGNPIDTPQPIESLLSLLWKAGPDSVYLSPAPLYHSAPLAFNMAMLALGGTTVIMEHFDAARALSLIAEHRVTHSQWVPTMFVRMLKLDRAEREAHDLSSLSCAIHAAAPCPIPIKQQMLEWWGPIIHEYYAGTEGNGCCYVGPEDWLAHPGTVGKALIGTVHVVGEDGEELPPGEPGTIYFESDSVFEYHNDPEKTADSRHAKGWTTLGDVGYVDAEGYLYLTDRKAHMIISGGVNIYPQETENRLIMHPKVADAAVIGVPNEEFGEEVKAVVQPIDMADVGEALAAELIAFCRAELSPIKCPRSIDFEAELPRHPTGKLYKRVIRDRYWQGKAGKLV